MLDTGFPPLHLSGHFSLVDAAREVQHIARRIVALLLLQPRLDANYRAITAETYAWPTRSESGQALML